MSLLSRRFLATTALAGFASLAIPAIAIVVTTPVLADGGNGGNSFQGVGGGTRGSGPNGGNGGNGGSGNEAGGGAGGGAGSGANPGGTGGNGGTGAGGAPGTGGAGGTAQSPNGADGTNGAAFSNSGGGGGGGGYSALSVNTLNNNANLTGGSGGQGGQAFVQGNGGGGGGGEGGYGAVVTGAGASSNSGMLAGGAGGQGGNSGGHGGDGGDGGIGVFFSSPGVSLTNTGTISGGDGGVPGPFAFGGIPGAGGIGVIGSGLTIDNTGGTIRGGLSGNGVTRNFAVQFTGGANFASYTGTYNGGINVTGGSFAPALTGSAIGTTLAITGPMTFGAGTAYNIRVSPTASDSVTASGAATLTGATVNATYSPGAYVSKQYTIVTASGLGGTTFAGLTNTSLPANATASLSYDATHAYLNLALAFAGPNIPGGLNANQQNVANALINFFNATGGIPAVFANLNANGLTQASNQGATGSQQPTFDAMTQFMGLMTDPFSGNRGEGGAGGATGYATERNPADAFASMYRKAPPRAFEARWNVWAAGYGGSQTTDGNVAVGSSTATSRIYGGAVGADYRANPDLLLGFALAGGGTNYSIANNLGTGRSDLFQAGAFARQNFGASYITAAFAYGWQDITTDRTVTIAGTDQLRARFNANAYSGRLEAGHRFATPMMGITPYAAGQVTLFDLPAYAEQAVTGANTFALAFAARDVTSTRSELGVRTDKSFALSDAVLTLRGRGAWAHNFDTDRVVNATFQALPGASFVVNGAAQAREAALVTAAAEVKWLTGFSLAATFEGEFSNVTQSYAGKGVARYQW